MNNKRILAAIASCWVAGSVSYGSETTNWSHGIIPLRREPELFSVDVAGCSFGHCYIGCSFENESSGQVKIAGMIKEGRFYGRADLFVSNALDAGWHKVDANTPLGEATTLVIKPHAPSNLIYVDVDTLIPLVERFCYAKVVLSTGDTATFAIKELQK